MKKLFLSISATLLCLLALSQEDNLGNYAELTFTPRLDLNPTYSDQKLGFNHGNTSIYTLFEGSASEHFSWTLANHWFSTGGDYAWPYKNLGHSDATNWLDFCKADLTFGNWCFTLGKDVISCGGMEFEDWDWDINTNFASPLWNNLASYQWGAKVAFTNNSENTTLSLQMVTSPYGARPFASGLFAYSAQWRGEYGWFSNIWSISALEKSRGTFDPLICLGQMVTFGDFSFVLDYSNCPGYYEDAQGDDFNLTSGHNVMVSANYAFSDKLYTSLKASYAYSSLLDINSMTNIGAMLDYYPLNDSDALRVTATAGYCPLCQEAFLSIGARYNFTIKLW